MAKQTFTTGQVLTAAQVTSLQQTAMGGGSATAKVASYVLVAADAGTVVQMNAAGATTITVNTSLFSNGDTVQITNIGVGVTTVTAGTCSVSSSGSLALNQFDSGTLYFTATGVSIFYGVGNVGDITGVTPGVGISGGGTSGTVTVTNSMQTTIDAAGDILYGTANDAVARLPIGTAAQELRVNAGATAPEWYTPSAASSALTQIGSTLTFSGSSSLDLSDKFSTTYDNYAFIIVFTSTNNGDLTYRWRVSGADNSTSNYNYQLMDVVSSTFTGSVAGAQTSGRICGIKASGERASVFGTIFSPFLTSAKQAIFDTALMVGSGIQIRKIHNVFDASTSFTGMTIIPSVGTVTGSVTIYGYSK